MKISVVGLAGSGKSTLATAISEKLSIPHIHIDRFWLEAGGRQGEHDTPNIEQVRAHLKEKVIESVSAPAWVSDGIFTRVQPEIASRADVVIFLDIPLWRRLLNHFNRTLQRSHRHKELSVWDDVRFFSEIIRRTFTAGPKLRLLLNDYKDKTITLKSRKEISLYLQNLK